MEKIVAYLYLGVFLCSIILFYKILMDSNLEKLFKQGKVSSIRATYLFLALLLSSITAWAFTSLINIFYTILS